MPVLIDGGRKLFDSNVNIAYLFDIDRPQAQAREEPPFAESLIRPERCGSSEATPKPCQPRETAARCGPEHQQPPDYRCWISQTFSGKNCSMKPWVMP